MIQITKTILLGLGLWLISTSASAQFDQYSSPGSFQETRESTEDLLDRSMKNARWRLGRVFLHPWIGLRDVSYSDQEADITATVGAGIRGYLPLGEFTLVMHVLPEYVWWKDQSERRQLNGRYGAGLFGNLGRTGVELSATRTDEARFFSRQLEERVNVREDFGKASIEVDVWGGLSLFARASLRRIQYLSQGNENLFHLEREEERFAFGVRFHLPRDLTIGLGVESSEADFIRDESRSNSGTSPVLQIEYDAGSLSVSADLYRLDLESESGSGFVPYEETAGSFQLKWQSTGRLAIRLYGHSNLVYSSSERWVYYQDSTLGVGIRTRLTSQMSLYFYGEEGQDEYTSFEPSSFAVRDDDFTSFGGNFRVGWNRFTLNLGVSRTDYDSTLPEFARSTTVISSSLTLGLGGGSPWG
jgi:hypothetical protein